MAENENILGFLHAVHPLSPALRERLQLTLKKEEYKKKTLLLKENQTSNKVYFIEKGLVRVYYVKNGVEICSGLLCEGGVLISVKSFFDRVRSEEYIQALEDLTVYYISYDELEALYLDLPEFNIVARKLITAYYVKSEERNYILRRHTAQEKITYFQEHFPNLLARVPRKDIASYLGVALETLSRLG
jgi:CRP/FNR family transcriptional regulator, anaerobic regulatory protein